MTTMTTKEFYNQFEKAGYRDFVNYVETRGDLISGVIERRYVLTDIDGQNPRIVKVEIQLGNHCVTSTEPSEYNLAYVDLARLEQRAAAINREIGAGIAVYVDSRYGDKDHIEYPTYIKVDDYSEDQEIGNLEWEISYREMGEYELAELISETSVYL